jgi:hypothetical protein
LQRRKTRTRRPELGAALLAALCLAGCGGGSGHRAAPQPKLPRTVALALASRSDEIAAALAGEDSCHAFTAARKLQQETVASINAGNIPAAFQEDLGSAVADLVSRIRCVPTANAAPENGKHKDRKPRRHEKKKHDEGD